MQIFYKSSKRYILFSFLPFALALAIFYYEYRNIWLLVVLIPIFYFLWHSFLRYAITIDTNSLSLKAPRWIYFPPVAINLKEVTEATIGQIGVLPPELRGNIQLDKMASSRKYNIQRVWQGGPSRTSSPGMQNTPLLFLKMQNGQIFSLATHTLAEPQRLYEQLKSLGVPIVF